MWRCWKEPVPPVLTNDFMRNEWSMGSRKFDSINKQDKNFLSRRKRNFQISFSPYKIENNLYFAKKMSHFGKKKRSYIREILYYTLFRQNGGIVRSNQATTNEPYDTFRLLYTIHHSIALDLPLPRPSPLSFLPYCTSKKRVYEYTMGERGRAPPSLHVG